MDKKIGNIHSIETMGTMDGPGLRTVVFMQGCPLHCKFCHNVDVTVHEDHQHFSPERLTQELLKNKAYWQNAASPRKIPGGVTFTGGDPILQADFVAATATLLHQEGVHVCVESSLFTQPKVVDQLLPVVDYWMVSIKHMDDETHQLITGGTNRVTLGNIRYLDSKLPDKRLRLRMVVIPGLTNTPEHLRQVNEFIASLKNVDAVELLPYSTMGVYKWEQIFKRYWLKGIRPGTPEDAQEAAQAFSLSNVSVIL